MRSVLKKYRSVLETFDSLIYDEYKSLDHDGIIDAIESKYSRCKIEEELQRADNEREALMDVMEANAKLIDLLNEIEEAEDY